MEEKVLTIRITTEKDTLVFTVEGYDEKSRTLPEEQTMLKQILSIPVVLTQSNPTYIYIHHPDCNYYRVRVR